MENCIDCRYGQYSGRDDKHLGKTDEKDVYCTLYRKWVGCNGSCDNYED